MGSDATSNTASRGSRSNVPALEVDQEGSVSRAEATRGTESIDLAHATQRRGAVLVGGSVGAGEDLSNNFEKRRDDVLEDVALGKHVGVGGTAVEGVAAVGVPVVIDSVQQSVATNLGRASRGVVDVVALEGDLVCAASKVKSPVMV